MNPAERPRFRPGDRVRVSRRRVRGHYRTPWYLRGRPGVVTAVIGQGRDPEKLAYHKPGVPERILYRVRFRQADLWPDYEGSMRDTVETDVFEHWLQPQRGGEA